MVTFLPVNNWMFHVANSLIVISYATPNILVLRSLLVVAFVMYCTWAWVILDVSLDVFIWNGVFLLLNLGHASYLIWMMRPVHFHSEELEQIYAAVFKDLHVSRRDFKTLAKCGSLESLKAGAAFAEEGAETVGLTVLVSGTVIGKRGTQDVIKLGENEFIDSPQYMSKSPKFGITFEAETDVRYLTWSKKSLSNLISADERFDAFVNAACGIDITNKLFAVDDTLMITVGMKPSRVNEPVANEPVP